MTMVIFETLVYSSLAASMVIISSVVLFFKTRQYRAQHLNLVSLGIFLQSMLPLSFIPQAFLEGQSYHTIISTLAIIGADLLVLGFVLTIWNLQIHQQVHVPKRMYILLVFVGFSLGWVIIGTRASWTGDGWVIIRSSEIRLVIFGPILWILIEMYIVFWNSIRYAKSLPGKLVMTYPIALTISFILLAAREELPFSNAFYQVWTGLGAITFTIAILKQPDVLVLPKVKVSKVIMVERESGLSLAEHPPEENEKTQLTSAALSGTLELIREISGKEDLPPKLGYVDYTISVYPGKRNSFFCISNGEHPLLTGIMNLLCERWDRQIKKEDGEVKRDSIRAFQEDVVSSLGIFLQADTIVE